MILKLQKLVQRSRTRLGLKTIMENPPVYAHSSNGAEFVVCPIPSYTTSVPKVA